MDYPEYSLVNNKGSSQDLCKHLLRFRKKINVQVRPYIFPGSDLTEVLASLAKLKEASDFSRFPKCIAV